MIDLLTQLAAVHRSVGREPGDPDEIVRVTLRRSYSTTAADLWEAITDPDRIARWFMPISGDLKVSGTFQLEGNAGGEILACEPPRLLRTTFGGPSSILQLTLSPVDTESTELVLEHSVPLAMAHSVAGALFVGPGWDGALLALGLFVDGQVAEDPRAAAASPEAVEYSQQSIELWAQVVADSGATAEETEGGRQAALAQFAPQEVG